MKKKPLTIVELARLGGKAKSAAKAAAARSNANKPPRPGGRPRGRPRKLKPGGCPPDCGHTDAEHRAFDAGMAAGKRNGLKAINPFNCETQEDEWEAWECGRSVTATP